MIEIRFTLSLSSQELLKYYRGDSNVVYVKDRRGKSMQFPAEVLRPYITREGVYGEFVLRADDNYKFIDIQKVS